MESLLEKFYLMCSILNIIIMMVLSSIKPPEEKQAEINRRRENREKAWKKYDELKKKFGTLQKINIKRD